MSFEPGDVVRFTEATMNFGRGEKAGLEAIVLKYDPEYVDVIETPRPVVWLNIREDCPYHVCYVEKVRPGYQLQDPIFSLEELDVSSWG